LEKRKQLRVSVVTRCEELGVCQGVKCKKCPNRKWINISEYNKVAELKTGLAPVKSEFVPPKL